LLTLIISKKTKPHLLIVLEIRSPGYEQSIDLLVKGIAVKVVGIPSMISPQDGLTGYIMPEKGQWFSKCFEDELSPRKTARQEGDNVTFVQNPF
jgi:hypothetical protein